MYVLFYAIHNINEVYNNKKHILFLSDQKLIKPYLQKKLAPHGQISEEAL